MKNKISITALCICSWFIMNGQIIHVPGDQSTIQGAIDLAIQGDTVLVDEGIYYENINFSGKAITVASQYMIDRDVTHIENTIIDGSQPQDPDEASVVMFNSGEDTTSVLCGFTLTGGTGTYESSISVRYGGAIGFDGAGGKVIYNHITGDTILSTGDVTGSGAAISAGPPGNNYLIYIAHNKIFNNYAGSDAAWAIGGAIDCRVNAIIKNNKVYNNTCYSENERAVGGAIYMTGDYLEMSNNIIDANTAISLSNQSWGGAAGGIFVALGSGIIEKNQITNNKVGSVFYGQAAGIMIEQVNPDMLIRNNCIQNNIHLTGSGYGGGIYIHAGPGLGNGKLYNNLINGNSAAFGGGLCFSNINSSEFEFINNTIASNEATVAGGAIYINTNSPLNITNSILWDNQSPGSPEIFDMFGCINVSYSSVCGGCPGTGNIDDDPLFDTIYICRLSENSPCIDTGDPSLGTDPDGTPPDMGCYPFFQGTQINVAKDGSGHFYSIQEAIDAATENDMVLVEEGTYYENINFNGKAITVASLFINDSLQSQIENTIINGSRPVNHELGAVVTFSSGEDNNSVLTGFTITGGSGNYLPPGGGWPAIRAGGGISINLAGPTISSNHIVANSAVIAGGMSDGAGISCGPPGTPYLLWLEDNLIADNYSSSGINPGAAGVSVFGPGMIINNTIANNLCESNTSQCGPGGLGCFYGDVTVQDNNITNNAAYSHGSTPTKLGGIGGGAVFLMSSGLVKDNTIENNRVKAVSGDTCFAAGALVEMCTPDILLDANTIANNGFDGTFCYGGGLAIWYGGATLHNNMIFGDSATYGGGICMFDTSQIVGAVEILNNTVSDNYAELGGKGLFSHRTNATVMNTIFWNPGNPVEDEIMQESGDLNITYSVVNGSFGTGEGNFYESPGFVGPQYVDYHLDEGSLCAGMGTNELFPLFDFDGDPRPLPAGNMPDMGADEILETGIFNPRESYDKELVMIFPNPVLSSTTIEYIIPEDGNVKLLISDINGKVVQRLVNSRILKGKYKMVFFPKNLQTGLYFLTFEINDTSNSKKLLLIQ